VRGSTGAASPEYSLLPEAGMRAPLVLFTSIIAAACSSSPVAESLPSPDAEASTGSIPGCYLVVLGGTPSADVTLPTLIELSREPAPGFVEPGRFAVREPGGSEPRAPISSWAPGSGGTLDLSLGGGYTGYNFTLRSAGQGSWTGKGVYFADMGLEPRPGPLAMRLMPRSCS
jgi:hypothetical protein